jgi:Flp pilus assembly protein TadD
MLARLCIGAALVAATAAVYAQVIDFGFVGLDDTQYVSANSHVRAGLTLETVAWAFSTTYFGNWHPLTWLSLMLDVELFGVTPGAHHLVNAALHAANGVLLFAMLARYGLWRAAFVAAVFCLHPLHVESVAWIAERKDVLSGLFWIGACHAWLRGRRTTTLALFALGLMTKPSVVTLPFALLLLDVWPLGRIAWSDAVRVRSLWPLVREKLPLFGLSLASCLVTLMAQDLATLGRLPLGARLGNAAVSYARYLGKTVWPTDLAVLYPHPMEWPPLVVIGALALLAALSALAVMLRRRAPYALAGWLWFVGVLVPMIGVVQVGTQALADRYTYLPLIGLSWIVAWGAVDAFGAQRRALAVAAAVALAALGATSFTQVSKWRDGVSLFSHALESTAPNPTARWLYGVALLRTGELEPGIENLERSVELEPGHWQPWSWLGKAHEQRGDLAAAEAAYRRALALEPGFTRGRNRLGRVLVNRGRLAEARAVFDHSIREDPDDPEAWESRGIVAEMEGQPEAALRYYREALRRQPRLAHARRRLEALEPLEPLEPLER